MIAIQADADGHPTVIEVLQVNGKIVETKVDSKRWREILMEEIDADETPRAIVPIQVADGTSFLGAFKSA